MMEYIVSGILVGVHVMSDQGIVRLLVTYVAATFLSRQWILGSRRSVQ